jgi:hypothetical protein
MGDSEDELIQEEEIPQKKQRKPITKKGDLRSEKSKLNILKAQEKLRMIREEKKRLQEEDSEDDGQIEIKLTKKEKKKPIAKKVIEEEPVKKKTLDDDDKLKGKMKKMKEYMKMLEEEVKELKRGNHPTVMIKESRPNEKAKAIAERLIKM